VNPGRGGGGNNHGRPDGGRGHPMQCFKCGGSHSLKVCTKATPAEEKDCLFPENLGPRKTAPASSHTANQASTTPSTEQANSAQTINVGRSSPRGVHWVEANHVTVVKPDDSEDELMPTQGPDLDEEVSDSESESSDTSFSPYDDMMPNFMPQDDSSSAPNFDFEATIEWSTMQIDPSAPDGYRIIPNDNTNFNGTIYSADNNVNMSDPNVSDFIEAIAQVQAFAEGVVNTPRFIHTSSSLHCRSCYYSSRRSRCRSGNEYHHRPQQH
jgi:hypothetical protein